MYLNRSFPGVKKRGIKVEVKAGELVGECTGPQKGKEGGEMSEKGWEERGRKHARKTRILVLSCVNGRGRFGGQPAGGHPKTFPRPRHALCAVPALKDLESACRVSTF